MKKKNKVRITHGANFERAAEVSLSLDSAPHEGAASVDLDLVNAEHMNVMHTLVANSIGQRSSDVSSGLDTINLQTLAAMRSLYEESNGDK